jgi:hypothetical protein
VKALVARGVLVVAAVNVPSLAALLYNVELRGLLLYVNREMFGGGGCSSWLKGFVCAIVICMAGSSFGQVGACR